ncbi:MAG: sialate O-acetylesterase [Bacteroidales bacterium]|nr:sialate O-acetylesterase [Bacteroidales bacterium]
MKKLVSILPLLLACSLQAKVTLPSFFSDNMVLQQKQDVAIWGWTDRARTVTIRPSWTRQAYKATPDSDGKWITRIPTPEAGGPWTISFNDGDKTQIQNVLTGEVWFCSGQSNMEMPVKGFHGQPVEGSADVILSAKPSVPIRICTIAKKYSLTVLDKCSGSWQEHTPSAVADASAVAYFFALKLHEVLGVPVGLLISDWGGTPIETWINRETLDREFQGEFNMSHLDHGIVPDKYPNCSPCMLFNGQVAPLVPFTFKGMLWYQGESNRDRAQQYARLQPAYVRMMREIFHNPEAPFYFVQIAPYDYSKNPATLCGYFYEAQEATLALIPHSGMAATVDIGEQRCIHPAAKRQVGDRLAYMALADEYGVRGIEERSPSYKSVEFKDGKAVVTFNVGPLGLAPLRQEIDGFELAGSDRVFHPAKGIPQGDKVTVHSDEVPDPVAVRYCFRNWCRGTLFNSYGLPALPFRSDDWQDI